MAGAHHRACQQCLVHLVAHGVRWWACSITELFNLTRNESGSLNLTMRFDGAALAFYLDDDCRAGALSKPARGGRVGYESWLYALTSARPAMRVLTPGDAYRRGPAGASAAGLPKQNEHLQPQQLPQRLCVGHNARNSNIHLCGLGL